MTGTAAYALAETLALHAGFPVRADDVEAFLRRKLVGSRYSLQRSPVRELLRRPQFFVPECGLAIEVDGGHAGWGGCSHRLQRISTDSAINCILFISTVARRAVTPCAIGETPVVVHHVRPRGQFGFRNFRRMKI